MKASRILYGLLILGLAVWLLVHFGGSDEALIEGQLAELQRLVGKSADESALESADRARRASELLTREFEIRLDPVGAKIRDMAGLGRPFVGLRQRAAQLTFGVDGLEIVVDDRLRRAESAFTARLFATVDGQPRTAAYPVKVRWREERGEWRMEDVHVGPQVEGSLF